MHGCGWTPEPQTCAYQCGDVPVILFRCASATQVISYPQLCGFMSSFILVFPSSSPSCLQATDGCFSSFCLEQFTTGTSSQMTDNSLSSSSRPVLCEVSPPWLLWTCFPYLCQKREERKPPKNYPSAKPPTQALLLSDTSWLFGF